MRERKRQEEEERKRKRKRKGDRSALGRAGHRRPWRAAIDGEREGRNGREERGRKKEKKRKTIGSLGRLIMASSKLSKIIDWP